MISRRTFIAQTIIGTLMLSSPIKILAENRASKKSSKKADNLFKIGMAGYTFVNFSLDKTLETMKQLDLHYLCIKDFHLPFASTEAEIDEFKAKLAACDIKGYAVGPIYMDSEKAIDNAFAYAKRVGVKLIVGVPNESLLPYVDKKVKEYDFNYAIHLHGPDNVLYPNAGHTWNLVKDLDPRIGICLDIGHDLRDNCDPVEDMLKYHTRVFDVHIKDVTAASKEGRGIELGRGLIDFPAFVKAMRNVGYDGVCSLEYEKDMKDPFLGIAESIGYFKAITAYEK